MSDLSVLSNQYETLIDTSDKVNNSIIAFKKKYLLSTHKRDKKYALLVVSQQDIADASKYILHFLSELSGLLRDTSTKSEDIPTIVVQDYVQKLQSNIPSVKEDVEEIVKAVKEKKELDNDQLQVMDKILMTLDSERKVLFRKLRSSREW